MLAGRKMDVAIDMHLIPRWDRKHGAEVVRSKSKGKTGLLSGTSRRSASTGECTSRWGCFTCQPSRTPLILCAG